MTDLFTILHSPTLRNILSSITIVIFTNNVIMTCISNLTPFCLHMDSSYHGLRTSGTHGDLCPRAYWPQIIAFWLDCDVATDYCHLSSHHSSSSSLYNLFWWMVVASRMIRGGQNGYFILKLILQLVKRVDMRTTKTRWMDGNWWTKQTREMSERIESWSIQWGRLVNDD